MRKIKKSKKGLSEMVSYVMLVIISISLAILVYAWLKTQLPKENDECPDRLSVIIKDINCDTSTNIVNITFQNKGFFNINGIALRISNRTGDIPAYNLMTGIKPWQNHSIVVNEVRNFTYFRYELKPGEEYKLSYNYTKFNQIKKIQLTPFISKQENGVLEAKQVVCINSIITQEVEVCN
jgi:hypothetical protein